MQKLYVLIILILSSAKLSAQFETDYKPITSSGQLPKDFVTLSAQKYKDAKNKISSEDKANVRKEKEKFLLKTNFAVDDILLSGKVLYNDPLSEYVNRVADNALSSDQGTRRELRFYVYKTTAVNAFSTNQGVVLVTTGLLAQLENEAQLAFIICHETIHYKEKHAIRQYLEEDKIQTGKGAYSQLDREERIVARCAFSKEEEKESDEKGLDLFLKSNYSTKHLIGVYDVLKYAYLPFDDITFDKSFLETADMKFPDDYYKKHTLEIDTKDILDDDSRSTHPSVRSRREKTEEGIKGADNNGKSDYVVGEKDFKYVRELSRFELSRLYTLHDHYESGLYNSYMLLKKYPNNLYLKKNIGFCLAGLAQYSNSNRFREVHYNSDSVEGKAQALFFLMFKLDSMQSGALNVVALAYATKLKTEYPNDGDISELYNNLLHSLVKTNKLGYSYFSANHYTPHVVAPKDTAKIVAVDISNQLPKDTAKVIVVDIKPEPTNEEGEKSKYEKLREKHTEVVKQEEENPAFTKYAFVGFMDKSWFKNDFQRMEDTTWQKKKTVEIETRNVYSRRPYYDKRIYALGLDKIVIVDPDYARINARKKEKYKYIESEGGQVDFAERLRLNAKKAKLGAEVLNTKNLDAGEAEKLNDVALMTDYISERLSHEKDVDMPFAERERIKALAKKYNTDYFMWTGAISLTDRNRWNVLLILYSAIFPPILPFTLAPMINGGQFTIYYALVYDVNTDEIKMSTYREIKNRTRGYILNSHIYDVLNQVKSKPSKATAKNESNNLSD